MSAHAHGRRLPRRIIGAVLCASVLAGVSITARASFHLFQLNEFYSNASGTVQFIELLEGFGADGQQFLAGHTLTVSQGVTTHSFVFPNNLPSSSTARHHVLIATPAFAMLGIVTPDYIVPAGFLFTGGATVNYAGVDSITYTALPTDGVSSIDRNGAVGMNLATNFAGQSGSIGAPPPPPPPNPLAVPTLRYESLAALILLLAAAAWRSRRRWSSNPRRDQ